MLNKTVEEALNRQVNREFYSSYLYLAMAAYANSINMKGSGHWLILQSTEEYGHGMKILNYIEEAGGAVKLLPIEAPKAPWKTLGEVFSEVYGHEQKVTKMIHDLVDLAGKEKDFATLNMLQWFVSEQVEEEANALEIVEKIKQIGDVTGHLFYLDKELGKRV